MAQLSRRLGTGETSALLTARYRVASLEEPGPDGAAGDELRREYRIGGTCGLPAGVSGLLRLDHVRAEGRSGGSGIMGTAGFAQALGGLTLSFRCALFRTDSYAARLHLAEQDLPGTAAMRALYGEGYRWYALASVVPFDGCVLSGRIAFEEAVRPGGIPHSDAAMAFGADLRF
jgi:hypothetical protein